MNGGESGKYKKSGNLLGREVPQPLRNLAGSHSYCSFRNTPTGGSGIRTPLVTSPAFRQPPLDCYHSATTLLPEGADLRGSG